jgi:hypothetical protein
MAVDLDRGIGFAVWVMKQFCGPGKLDQLGRLTAAFVLLLCLLDLGS